MPAIAFSDTSISGVCTMLSTQKILTKFEVDIYGHRLLTYDVFAANELCDFVTLTLFTYCL